MVQKKVCMLVKNHSFLDARIFKKEARSLLKNGFDVTMVVPTNKGYLFDIEKKPITDRFLSPTFVYEGIKIVTFDPRENNPSLSQMAANLQSDDPDSFIDPLTRIGLAQEADIYHAHEIQSFYSGVGIKRIMSSKGKNVKLIYDSHEVTPDPFDDKNEERVTTFQLMLNIMLKEVDYIITVSESIKAWYLTFNPRLPVEIIYNSPPLAEKHKKKEIKHKGLVACYEGLVHRTKGSQEKIIEITERCNKLIDFKFKVIGTTRSDEAFQVPAHLQDKVILTGGFVDYYSIPKLMADAHVGWIDFDLTSLNRPFALPNKFFSYLNNGIPVLVNKCNDMENFIRTHNCGLVIDKLNPTAEDYANALLYLYKNKDILKTMSRNARKVMEEKYSWEQVEKRLFAVYDRLLNPDKIRYIF